MNRFTKKIFLVGLLMVTISVAANFKIGATNNKISLTLDGVESQVGISVYNINGREMIFTPFDRM